MTASDDPKAEFIRLFFNGKRTLILTHVRPDGDACGSAMGLCLFMRENGADAQVYFPERPPEAYAAFFPFAPEKPEGRFEQVFVLDCATNARIADGGLLHDTCLAGVPVYNLDHHMSAMTGAAFSLVDEQAAAASLLAAELALASGRPIGKQAATLWYLGITTDTGCFRFSNTDARTLRVAAALLERGADLETIINRVYFTKPATRQELEAELVLNCLKTAFDGKLVYCHLSEEMMARHHFSMRDGEGLIDLLREREGGIIAALLYRKDGAWKFSLRSKDRDFPVDPVARRYHGGGHQMAAGMTVEAATPEEAEALLLKEIGALLNRQR